MNSGIYCIENLKNNKKYIGQSSDLKTRESLHFCYLRNNTHDNPHLQYSYNKYGNKYFKFKILLYCEPFELTRYEQEIININNSNMLYNIRLDCVDSNLGVRHTQETIEHLRRVNLGKNNPMYGKSGKKHHMWGVRGENHPLHGIPRKPFTKETKNKMAKSQQRLSKLSEKDIYDILTFYYIDEKMQKDIATIFNVCNMTISKVVRGKTWKHCYSNFMETYNAKK